MKINFNQFSIVFLGLIYGATPMLAQSYVFAEDEAYYDAYNDGWQSGDQSGRGFGDWRLFSPEYTKEDEEQYAGFFTANTESNSDLKQSAREGKALGIFANGTGFEETAAFRAFDGPLQSGDVFSMRFEFDGFTNRFERDSEAISSVGFALRAEADAVGLSELGKGRAMVFAVIKGLSTYQILDADPRFNTRVFIDPEGVDVGITIHDDFRYDLQIITLSDNVVHHFPDRSFNWEAPKGTFENKGGQKIQSFALFNLNGGSSNVYFGAFQVSRLEN
ncbi:hypothetical protein [Cerasicoccus arenae]|nr:hypothetical protein [Cerasicoccus arenae]MBK1857191.1 hypothetical protein [Cerasicoccus arenae]